MADFSSVADILRDGWQKIFPPLTFDADELDGEFVRCESEHETIEGQVFAVAGDMVWIYGELSIDGEVVQIGEWLRDGAACVRTQPPHWWKQG